MIQNLTTEQRKIIASKQLNIIVNPYEAAIIQEVRKQQHGEIIIVVMDGIPYRVKVNTSIIMEQSEDFEDILAQVLKQGIIK